jgi:hypothetical protein
MVEASGNDIVGKLWEALARHVLIVFGRQVRTERAGPQRSWRPTAERSCLWPSASPTARRLPRSKRRRPRLRSTVATSPAETRRGAITERGARTMATGRIKRTATEAWQGESILGEYGPLI